MIEIIKRKKTYFKSKNETIKLPKIDWWSSRTLDIGAHNRPAWHDESRVSKVVGFQQPTNVNYVFRIV